MKVCVVNQAGMFGGAEVHTLRLVQQLAGRGHAVDIIECGDRVIEKRCSAISMPVGVRFIPVRLSTDTNDPRDLGRWVKIVRLTGASRAILIKNSYRRGALMFLLALRLACDRITFIEHLEAVPAGTRGGTYFGVIPRLGLWRFRDRLLRKLPGILVDDVIAVSDKVRERLIADCGYAARKISVVRNGVAWQEYKRDTAAGEAFRASLSIPLDHCLVTILARLEYAKGIDVALRAIALLRRLTPRRPIHLLIAGTGSLESNLRQQVKSLGLADTVTFAGFLSDPKPALWASDAILFSSRLEGLPLGLLEGMAAGCLPVVTRVSGMPEVVSKPEFGWVVEPDDPAAVAEAILTLSSLDDRNIDAFRQRVVAHIKEHFDLFRSQQLLVERLGL